MACSLKRGGAEIDLVLDELSDVLPAESDPAKEAEARELVEAVREKTDAFFISDIYYTPQFVNGGALLLMNQVPDQVNDDIWGELSVQTFTCSTWRDWQTGETGNYDIPLNHIILFHPEQGWIFCIRGDLPMEELMEIARNVEVEQTEGLVEHSQFRNPYDIFDAGQG